MVFLRAIGNDHPLMDLILRCINNDPRRRAHANEIVERMTAIVLQFPASFANRLEMLRQIEDLIEEKRALREEGEAKIQQKDEEILKLQNEANEKDEKNAQLNLVYSSEVDQLKLEVRDLNVQNQLLTDTKEADVTELKTKVAAYEYQNNEVKREIAALTNEKQQLEIEISRSVTETNTLKHKVSTLTGETSRKTATVDRNESELKSKTRALEEKEAIISGMREQLTKAREHLSSKQQVSSEHIQYNWKRKINLELYIPPPPPPPLYVKDRVLFSSTNNCEVDLIATQTF